MVTRFFGRHRGLVWLPALHLCISKNCLPSESAWKDGYFEVLYITNIHFFFTSSASNLFLGVAMITLGQVIAYGIGVGFFPSTADGGGWRSVSELSQLASRQLSFLFLARES